MSDEHPAATPSEEQVMLALRHCWQPVARVQDLRQGPQRAVLLDQPLVVFLGESGRAAVLADRCGHRGASLSLGEVRGDAVQCPYHGWEWAGTDGACLRIPSLEDQRQIPPGAKVPAFPVREQWGLVWATLEEPCGEPPTVPWFDPDAWECAHGMPFELPVAFGVMIENFRDVAHFAFVHRATLGDLPETIEPLQVQRDGVAVTMRRSMRAGQGADQVWGSLRELRNYVIAPNFTSAQMLMSKGERGLLHASRAISATESAHYWIEGLSPDYDEHSLEEAIESEERLYAEDRAIVSSVRPPQLPLDPNAGFSTLADGFTLSYRLAFAEFVDRALSEHRTHPSSKAS